MTLKSTQNWVQQDRNFNPFFNKITEIGDMKGDKTKISDHEALEEHHFKTNYNEDEKDEYVKEA